MCLLSHFSRVQLSVTPWIVAHQAPLSMAFPREGYQSGLPFSPPGDVPDPGIEPVSPMAPTLSAKFFTTEPRGEALLWTVKLLMLEIKSSIHILGVQLIIRNHNDL